MSDSKIQSGVWPLIQGDTYRVKDELKAMGAQWDAQMKGWRIHPDRYDEARLLVDNCEGQMSFEEEENEPDTEP